MALAVEGPAEGGNGQVLMAAQVDVVGQHHPPPLGPGVQGAVLGQFDKILCRGQGDEERRPRPPGSAEKGARPGPSGRPASYCVVSWSVPSCRSVSSPPSFCGGGSPSGSAGLAGSVGGRRALIGPGADEGRDIAADHALDVGVHHAGDPAPDPAIDVDRAGGPAHGTRGR